MRRHPVSPLSPLPSILAKPCQGNWRRLTLPRYRVAIPPIEERPPAVTVGPKPDLTDPKTARLPYSAACHCNDCRCATGGTTMDFLAIPAPYMTVSALPRSESEDSDPSRGITGRLFDRPLSESEAQAPDADRPPYLPAVDVLRPGVPGSRGTWLRFFHAFMCHKDVAARPFCSRCGGQLGMSFQPRPEYFGGDEVFCPPAWSGGVIDVALGTIDRHWLDREDWFAIDHELVWDDGLQWAKRESVRGKAPGVRRHPGGAVMVTVAEADLLAPAKTETK